MITNKIKTALNDTPMIAQVLPVFKLLKEFAVYAFGLELYSFKSLFDNTIAIMPQTKPGNPYKKQLAIEIIPSIKTV
ncbi:MAG: hypothetical protein NTZ59_06865 [Bacteroidetes bacterium]|nr:hypothetical protein [Bacteroidota bacterium]